MLPFAHTDTATLLGNWPFTQGSPSGGSPVMKPAALDVQATILGIRREPTSAFDVDGKSFYLWIDDKVTGRPVRKTIQFATGANLTLASVVTQINTSNGAVSLGVDDPDGAVAFNDNGFLRLQSPRKGEKSYLRLESVLTSEAVFNELGLFSETVSRGGDVRQTQHVDPLREIALPGQAAVGWGEDVTHAVVNRMLYKQALNLDRLHGLLDRKRVAVKGRKTVTYTTGADADTTNRTLRINDVVFTGRVGAPTIEELRDLVGVLDANGHEIVEESNFVLTSHAGTLNFSIEADTNNQLVTVTGGATPFSSFDTGDDVYIVASNLTGSPNLNGVPLKIIKYISPTVAVVQNVDPFTGSVLQIAQTGRTGDRVKIYTLRCVVDRFATSAAAATRVEGLRSKLNVTGTGNVTRIERNNRVFVTDAAFVADGVAEGDLVRWTGAVPTQPFSNNGYYRITKVVDVKTLELASGWRVAASKAVGNSVSFSDNGASPDTITRAVGSFVDDGFVAGQKLFVSKAANPVNNGLFIIDVVAALTLTLSSSAHLVTNASDSAAVLDGVDNEDDYGPVYLNPDTTGALGAIEVLSDGEFWNKPWIRLAAVDITTGIGALPASGVQVQIVYLGKSSIRGASNNIDLFAGVSPRFVQEATTDVQRAIMRIIGPSVKSFSEVLYTQNWNSIEALDFRLDKEHNLEGRHSSIRPDNVDFFPEVLGRTLTLRTATADTAATIKFGHLNAAGTGYHFKIRADGSVAVGDVSDVTPSGTTFSVARDTGDTTLFSRAVAGKTISTFRGTATIASALPRDGEVRLVLRNSSRAFHISSQSVSASTTSNFLRVDLDDGAGGSPLDALLVIKANGSVGIAAADPLVPLHIKARGTGEAEQVRLEGFSTAHTTVSQTFYPTGSLFGAVQFDKDVGLNEWSLNIVSYPAAAVASATAKAPVRVVVDGSERLRVDAITSKFSGALDVTGNLTVAPSGLVFTNIGKLNVDGKQVWRRVGNNADTFEVEATTSLVTMKSVSPSLLNFDFVLAHSGAPGGGSPKFVLKIADSATPAALMTFEAAKVWPNDAVAELGVSSNPWYVGWFRQAKGTVAADGVHQPAGTFLTTHTLTAAGSETNPMAALEAKLTLNQSTGQTLNGHAYASDSHLVLTAGTFTGASDVVAAHSVRISSAASAFAASIVAGLWVHDMVLPAASAVVNQAGILVEDWTNNASGKAYALFSKALHPSRWYGALDVEAQSGIATGTDGRTWRVWNVNGRLSFDSSDQASSVFNPGWAFQPDSLGTDALLPGTTGTHDIGTAALAIRDAFLANLKLVAAGSVQSTLSLVSNKPNFNTALKANDYEWSSGGVTAHQNLVINFCGADADGLVIGATNLRAGIVVVTSTTEAVFKFPLPKGTVISGVSLTHIRGTAVAGTSMHLCMVRKAPAFGAQLVFNHEFATAAAQTTSSFTSATTPSITDVGNDGAAVNALPLTVGDDECIYLYVDMKQGDAGDCRVEGGTITVDFTLPAVGKFNI